MWINKEEDKSKMSEIIEALNQLEKERNISKDLIMDAIEKSVQAACEKDFGKESDFSVIMDRETGEIQIFTAKVVVPDAPMSPNEISLDDARKLNPDVQVDDEITVETTTQNFGRIAAQKARNIIVQAIKESEKISAFVKFSDKKDDILTGVIQRIQDNSVRISLDDHTETILSEKEMIPGEVYRVGDRIKVYVVDVKESQKGFRIIVSRTHPNLVKRLFEREVAEVADGTVEIKSISREAGSRTKIAVYSNDANVDAVGACVGLNGTRVNNIVENLMGEKIDIIEWDEDPAIYIEHALSPSKVVSVDVTPGEKSAKVVVPDYQLSLAIGKEGQNARLAARLTGYKIDIKSETQARQAEMDEEDYEEYEEEYEDEAFEEEAESVEAEEAEAEEAVTEEEVEENEE